MRLPVIRHLPQRHAEIDHCKPRFRTRPVQVATGQDSCRLPDRIIVAHQMPAAGTPGGWLEGNCLVPAIDGFESPWPGMASMAR